MNKAGLTLLESMVALVVLGLVATASFQLYATALRSAYDAQAWSTAAAYAEEGMELAKIDLRRMTARSPESLGEGFERTVRIRPVTGGMAEVTISMTLPGGGQFEVSRLVPQS